MFDRRANRVSQIAAEHRIFRLNFAYPLHKLSVIPLPVIDVPLILVEIDSECARYQLSFHHVAGNACCSLQGFQGMQQDGLFFDVKGVHCSKFLICSRFVNN